MSILPSLVNARFLALVATVAAWAVARVAAAAAAAAAAASAAAAAADDAAAAADAAATAAAGIGFQRNWVEGSGNCAYAFLSSPLVRKKNPPQK